MKKQNNFNKVTAQGYKVALVRTNYKGDTIALIEKNNKYCKDGIEWTTAYGYDVNTGTWLQGHYCGAIKSALACFNSYFEGEQVQQIKDVKQGAFIRLIRGARVCDRVYTRKEYDRTEKGYYIDAWDDISESRVIKSNALVLINFSF